jgi:hypothetical protein
MLLMFTLHDIHFPCRHCRHGIPVSTNELVSGDLFASGGSQIRWRGWRGSDPVNGFQGLRDRLSFKPKPLSGSDPNGARLVRKS